MFSRVLFVCLLFGVSFGVPLNAASPGHAADSLRKVLFRTDDTKEQVRLYLELSRSFENDLPDSSLHYLATARMLAMQVEDPGLIGNVYYDLGNVAVIRNQLDLAFSYYKVAAMFFKRADDNLGYARMLMLQGNINGVRDDAGAAMTFFMEAIDIAEKYKYNNILSHLYNNMGDIYQQSNDLKKAMEYYTQALRVFIANKDSANMGNALLNIGMVYYNLGNAEMARHYTNRSLEIFMHEKNSFSAANCMMNLGMIESGQGNGLRALELLNRSYAMAGEGSQSYRGPKDILRSEILIRTGINALRMRDFQQARNFLFQGYNLARTMKQPRMVILATENLSKTFEKLSADKEALFYYKLYMSESDSLSKVITVRSVELTEIRQEYFKKQKENELRIAFEKSGKRTMLIIYIISGVILLAAVVILFLLLKLERQRKKESEIEKKALDEKLEFQNREMTTNVMHINRMNEQVVQIAEKLKTLSIDDGSENARIIKTIIRELGQGSQNDPLKEFEVRFQKINSIFYRNLTEKFPDLTPNELKLCAFLRLNMSTKEISALTYQSENSIMVARTRLRQKLDITRNENLVTFLSQF
jgi:tetratricopeptide (TPR) repeat protein